MLPVKILLVDVAITRNVQKSKRTQLQLSPFAHRFGKTYESRISFRFGKDNNYFDTLCNLWWHYLQTESKLLQLYATDNLCNPSYLVKLSIWCISKAGVTTPLDRHTSQSGFYCSLASLNFFHSVLWQIFYLDSLLIFLT